MTLPAYLPVTVCLPAADACLSAVRPVDPPAPARNLIRLRRDGLRPLRFYGRLIASHDGRLPATMLWHDIALYRTEAAAFAVEIVAQLLVAPKCASGNFQIRPTRCHAAQFDTLDGALTLLECHDPSGDICPGISAPALSLDDPTVPPAMLMMQAAILHGLCRDVVRRYRIGVGVLLANIGLQHV